MSKSKKKVVVIGGGNGSATSIQALKQFIDELEIAAVVSMSDSGGSSGRLRKEYNTLPAGDIMRAVLAMSPHQYHGLLKNIFHINRFQNVGKLDGHNLGNLFLVWAEQYAGDFVSGVRALEQAVEAVGTVYPVTLDKTDLVVELTNGDIVKGEAEIDEPDYDRSLRIQKAWLEPAAKVFAGAKEAVEEADYIVLGPGSFYTSIIATLLSEGVREAIDKSSAKLIYICGGAREKNGETGPVKASAFLGALESHLPRPLHAVVCNDHVKTEKEIKVYEEKGWVKIEFDKENLEEYNIVRADFEKEGGGLSPEKLAKTLKNIICS